MTWRVEFQDSARKDLRKLGQPIEGRILRYLRQRIGTDEDPERFGKALTGNLGEYWCYRVGDHRVLCEIFHATRIVRVRTIGHRREVYSR